MSILHIASFRWKPEVAEIDIARLTDALNEMRAGIPEIRSYVVGPNLHLRAGGADYGVAAILDDGAGLDTYLDHVDHKAVYEKYLGWMIAERSAVQLPISAGAFDA
ncbi:Dabb family protein [Herbiconiux ginsengi]|uniref:Stress responsive A/B Barrel Domain n=1 Tax=Herbiconiux ginsengi TaxID=381665 RepID=A0A1H3TXN5_9MICO|nr:Dabb family protein [Herbiconiux ginsengi]SDZ54009.1 Stress responsive A/B Barrel Domain [Herbiconiux ginsengi]